MDRTVASGTAFCIADGRDTARHTNEISESPARDRVVSIPEILGHILDHCERIDLFRICRVCSVWRAIIGAFTHLGAFVIYKFNRSYPDNFARFRSDMRRGGRRRVAIRLENIPGDQPEFTQLLGLSAPRIWRLEASGLTRLSLIRLWDVLQQGMPAMRELILQSVWFGHGPDLTLETFTNQRLLMALPHLRRVSYDGIVARGSHEPLKSLDAVTLLSLPGHGRQAASRLWRAEWTYPSPPSGLAIREIWASRPFEPWVATVWSGDAEASAFSEQALHGVPDVVFRSRESHRRQICLYDPVRLSFFHTGITILSLPLHFWGRARVDIGTVTLPKLIFLHILLVGLSDDGPLSDEERLICPSLRCIGLGRILGAEAAYLAPHCPPVLECTAQDVEELIQRVVRYGQTPKVQLIGHNIALRSVFESTVSFSEHPQIPDLQSWLEDVECI